MTVRDLIEILTKIDKDGGGNRIVIISQDAEGNGYNKLYRSGINTGSYADGEVGLEELTPELIKQRYTEEDLLDGEPALILYP